MFTTECSNPWAKNTNTGIHVVAILPMVDVELMESTMARQTIQLHSMAFTKTVTSPAKP